MRLSFLSILMLALVTVGCAPMAKFEVNESYQLNWGDPETADALAAAQPTGSDFTKALVAEYKTLSDFEKGQYDWRDHERWARKGLAAVDGSMVHPELPERWNLSKMNYAKGKGDTSLSDLYKYRERLMEAFYFCKAREKMPKESAAAQASYDCWIEELEERWDDAAITQCKSRFMTNLEAIEKLCGAKPAEQVSFKVLFDFNSDAVNAKAMDVVSEIAAAAGKNNMVSLVGWADRVGNPVYNLQLSKRRVLAVKDALIAKGVPADNISASAKGESELPKSTDDEVKEQMNRAVHVVVTR